MKVLQMKVNQKAFKKVSTQTKKYVIDETEDEEPLVADNPAINELSKFNLFECDKNLLKNMYATCEQAFMATSKYNYYT